MVSEFTLSRLLSRFIAMRTFPWAALLTLAGGSCATEDATRLIVESRQTETTQTPSASPPTPDRAPLPVGTRSGLTPARPDADVSRRALFGETDGEPRREATLPDAGKQTDNSPPPSKCRLGVTIAGEFQPVAEGEAFTMVGGAQANLILSLAVATDTVIPVEESRTRVSVDSTFGTTSNGYILGGPSPRCNEQWGCHLINLNVGTESLAADPFDLADLAVRVAATINLSTGPYCEIEVTGRLQRAE